MAYIDDFEHDYTLPDASSGFVPIYDLFEPRPPLHAYMLKMAKRDRIYRRLRRKGMCVGIQTNILGIGPFIAASDVIRECDCVLRPWTMYLVMNYSAQPASWQARNRDGGAYAMAAFSHIDDLTAFSLHMPHFSNDNRTLVHF